MNTRGSYDDYDGCYGDEWVPADAEGPAAVNLLAAGVFTGEHAAVECWREWAHVATHEHLLALAEFVAHPIHAVSAAAHEALTHHTGTHVVHAWADDLQTAYLLAICDN